MKFPGNCMLPWMTLWTLLFTVKLQKAMVQAEIGLSVQVTLPEFSFHQENHDQSWLIGFISAQVENKWTIGAENIHTSTDGSTFSVAESEISPKCMLTSLSPMGLSTNQKLCFRTRDSMWYGGGELYFQRWPLKNTSIPLQRFVTRDVAYANFNSYGNVLERYWVSSKGAGIYINSDHPLFASYNENEMCFSFEGDSERYYVYSFERKLQITVCKTDNVKETHILMSGLFIKNPDGIPDARMFRSPIWSTWAKYKVNIDEESVLQFANEISEHGFSNSQLEIDDMFSTKYGEFDFDPQKFPDPSEMISKLKQKGFRVTAWIIPFADLDSKAFKIGMEKGYWMKFSKDGVPALVKWWQGIGSLIDVFNPEAVRWFLGRLSDMKDRYGIDSFKFDAGETDFVPTAEGVAYINNDTSTFATQYVKAVSEMGPFIEVRCGYRSQQYPVFVRMADKFSDWSYANGLKTIIPTALTFSLLGYPYILPDMIGGNGYEFASDALDIVFNSTILPDRELYIRWLELTAYLPSMQFSITPWQYDDEVVRIARKYVTIHEEVVTPIVLEAAKDIVKYGNPIIRPLWWLAPEDIDALECGTQFLVGDHLLVAPVLEKGAFKRDVYLPAGRWEDGNSGETIVGGRWVKNYEAKIDQVPTFTLVTENV